MEENLTYKFLKRRFLIAKQVIGDFEKIQTYDRTQLAFVENNAELEALQWVIAHNRQHLALLNQYIRDFYEYCQEHKIFFV